jgi:hypothetical protein
MKKLFSLLIVTFMAVGNVLAAEISAEQALQIATAHGDRNLVYMTFF